MRLEAFELRRVRLPLVTPFRTSFGTQSARDILLVRALADDTEGWGECVALPTPMYSSEYIDGAEDVIARFLAPPLVAAGDGITADDVAGILSRVHGHRMARAAVELAVLDAELRAEGRSLASRLGAVTDRVPAGVSVGIQPSVGALLDTVAGYVEAGYARVKLKIEPGHDLEPVRAVRETHPDLPLQVDANAAYTLDDAEHLAELDGLDLLLVEQPFAPDRLGDHARLARHMTTPICLDESITSEAVCADAIAMGATSIVNLKAGRVGGYLAARRIADRCADAGVPVWCGGMVEAGIGRAANVALAACPNFDLPGDVSASDRFFSRDLIEVPFTVEDGTIGVPDGAGLGVDLDTDWFDQCTTSRRLVRDDPGERHG